MADANVPSRPSPPDWGDAFAAMPAEHPPRDAWARLSAALPHRAPQRAPPAVRRRSRLHAALVTAASLAIALPLAWWLGSAAQAPARHPAIVVASAEPSATQPVARSERGLPPLTTRSDLPHPESPAAGTRVADRSSEGAPQDRAAPRTMTTAAVRNPAAWIADSGEPEPRAEGLPRASSAAGHHPSDAGPASEVEDSRLATLRQESARLEAFVSYARDDRLTTAPVVVMSAAIDDRIRLIDSALMQADLDESMRSTLWSERVAALQELASLEGTQRWMAAHGAAMDAMARVD